MNTRIRQLLAIKDKNDNYFLDAKEVAKFNGVGLNAVYESKESNPKQQILKKAKLAKGKPFIADKLYKLYAFEELKKELLKAETEKVVINGNKEFISEHIATLNQDKQYEITIKEI